MTRGIVEYVDRHGTNSSKWDGGLKKMFGSDDLLAMWVADMDFKVPSVVTEAIKKYLETEVIGYYVPSDRYFNAFMNWEKKNFGLDVDRSWIRFSPGVVAGFNWCINMLTQPGDAVIVMTPVYYPFSDAIRNNERKLVASELVNTNGVYTIDFEDFEAKIVENDVKAFVLCSPHNPVGRVWTAEECEKMLSICKKHGVYIIADEIHQDFVFADNKQTPMLTLEGSRDNVILLTAASKTFNLAGGQNSFVVIPSEELRAKWDKLTACIRVTSGNPFGYEAVTAAYESGEDWYEEVKEIIYDNFCYMRDALAEKLPKAVVTPLEGTYLAWVDLSAYVTEDNIKEVMQEKCKLAFDYGEWFGGDKSGTHVRINLATRRENVEEAVRRLSENL